MVNDKSGRCWTCSSQKHLKQDCPTMKYGSGDGDPPKGSVGGSEVPYGGKPGGGKNAFKGTGKKGGKKGKVGGGNGTTGNGSRGAAGSGATGNGKGQGHDQQGQGDGNDAGDGKEKEVENQKDKKEGEKGGSEKPETKILEEVTHLLKTMRVQGAGPQIRVCQVKQLSASEPKSALLDSGATHCLRSTSSSQEWSNATPVRVKLASGEIERRQCPETATLLSREEVQMVVPVAKILEVGYTMLWTKEGCRVEHPGLGKVPVKLVQGCPTVDDEWGRKMMMDVEEFERKRAKIRSILSDGVLAEDEHEKNVAELRSLFPQVPLRVLERIPGEEAWDVNQLPFNRKARRKIWRAKLGMVNMFAGGDVKRWTVVEDRSTAVISIDVMHGGNALCPHLTGWLNSIIDTGKVVMWTSGPPCRSVSVLRQRGDWDGGPQQLRTRNGDQRFGLHGLTAAQREMVDHDSALWVKNLWWMRYVKKKNPKAKLVLEQPQDPEEWREKREDEEACPSFLVWPETCETVEQLKLVTTRFEQGTVGAATPKPTAVINNVHELQALEGLKASQRSEEWPMQVQEGIEKSKRMAQWAPGMVNAIVEAMRKLKAEEEKMVKTLTTKERAEIVDWEAHFASGHIPFRRDCMLCLESMGRSRPRRRQSHPDSYTMAVDIAGPFQQGEDQELHNPRYLMVATVAVPAKSGDPLPYGLKEMGYRKSKGNSGMEKLQEEDQDEVGQREGSNLGAHGREEEPEEGSNLGAHGREEEPEEGIILGANGRDKKNQRKRSGVEKKKNHKKNYLKQK